MTTPQTVDVDLDGVFGDTHSAWRAFLDHLVKRFSAIEPLDVGSLSPDRNEAASQLDVWAATGVGDWRGQLTRFAEDHLPVYVRPNASAMSAARSLVAGGVELRVYSDAPQELVDVAAAHLGLTRICERCEGGVDAQELTNRPVLVRTAAELNALLKPG